MKLSELLYAAGLAPESPFSDCEITEVVTDSRRAGYGCLFVCLSGTVADGHAYVKQALIKGASCVVVESGIPADLPPYHNKVNIVYCSNTRLAAAKLYSAWYGDPAKKLRLIAVTGTNGKTSVTVMLKAIFEAAYYKCGIIGTVACYSGRRRILASPDDPLANMTTPDPRQLYRMLAFMAADRVDYVFIEASSHALKLYKLDAIEFECGIFTNLTTDHLDFHGTMEDYLASKLRLFNLCKCGLINADSPYFESVKREAEKHCSIKSFSALGRGADFRVEDLSYNGANGINYTLISKNTVVKIKSPIPGEFTVDNTLCAASCALMMGIPATTIRAGIGSLFGVDGRVERLKTGCDAKFSIFIDYAHTPDALERLLQSFRGMLRGDGRLILLFGCGGDRDRTKRAAMGRIASRLADRCIITSDNSRSEQAKNIIADIMSGFDRECPFDIVEDRRLAIELAVKTAREGDIIILAGKGHEGYEIDQMGRHEFNEKIIAVEAVKKYCKK